MKSRVVSRLLAQGRTRAAVLAGSLLLGLSGAGIAWASGAVTATLTPDLPGRGSVVNVTAQGPFAPQSRLPSAIEALFARGFAVDPRSTRAKCHAPPSGGSCPGASRIGQGQATFHVTTSVGVGSGDYTATFKLFLGAPSQPGDIASVLMQGSVGGQQFTTQGRLFKVSQDPYGLELLTQVPRQEPPAGVTITVTLENLTLNLGTHRKVISHSARHRHRRVHWLITNPPGCDSGSWPGELVTTYSDGSSQSYPFTAACRQG